MSTAEISQDLERQRDYARRRRANGRLELIVADAFVRGMRDIGYRDTSRALDELIDNAIQAEATEVLIVFAFEGGSDRQPSSIAIVDNGHGMDREMLPLAAMWGGTHRENDRGGFGRYGYGLPSACVSQGQSFTVASLVEGGQLHAVTFDLDGVTRGDYTVDGTIQMPDAAPAYLPDWLADAIDDHERLFADGFTHGTAVVIDRLDRLSWRTITTIERQLLQAIGVTYRNFLRDVSIFVGDKRVEPIDPLFITPGFRFYDLDEDRAEGIDPYSFEVKDADSREVVGIVKVRGSYLPPTFARVDKEVERGKNNARLPVMSDHNGIIVLREGRQIDVVTQRGKLSVNNDDRYWKIEIDVPATLDEEMSITTSKQRVVLSERMWDLLEKAGVLGNIRTLRRRYDDDKDKLRAERKKRVLEKAEQARSSETAWEAAQKYDTSKASETPEKRRKAREAFERERDRRARDSGVAPEQVEQQLEVELTAKNYRVDTESLKGAPFFRVEQISSQLVLWLNRAHRFYKDVYDSPDSNERMRSALEVVLFAIGASAFEAEADRETFYETEIGLWSTRLNAALAELDKIDTPQEVRPTDEEERESAGIQDEDEGDDAEAA